MSYIGLGRRSIAWLIDVLITGLAWLPFAQTESGDGTLTIRWEGMDAVWPAVITLAYFVLLEGLVGATVGKLVVGIRVRGLTGGRIGLGPALVRNLARVVDAFPYVIPYLVGAIAVSRSDSKQRLGDRWAGTVVVLVGTEREAGETAAPAAPIGASAAGPEPYGLPSPPLAPPSAPPSAPRAASGAETPSSGLPPPPP